MSEELDDLKAVMDEAKQAYIAAKNSYESALCLAYPFNEGDFIQSTTGVIAVVKELRVEFGQVKVKAYCQEVDGSFGTREVSSWHEEWKHATIVEKRLIDENG